MYSEEQSTILTRMLSKLSSDIDKSEGSFARDSVSSTADEISQISSKLDNLLNNAFALTATDIYLDMKASEVGISRNTGTKSDGLAIFQGTDGTQIPLGTKIQTSDGLQFTTTQIGVISSGTISIPIEAIEVGVKYNLPAGVITQLPVQIVGVTEVSNTETIDGSDVEDDNSLLLRYMQQKQQPATTGNLSSYLTWSKEVKGILDAKGYPRWNGPNTIKIVLLSSDKKSPSQSKIDEVSNYIEDRRPIGADVTVVGASELSIDIKLQITLKVNGTQTNAITQIQNTIIDYFNSLAFSDSIVRYSKVGEAILSADDVLDYENLTINNSTGNIQLNDDQIPVLGAIQLI